MKFVEAANFTLPAHVNPPATSSLVGGELLARDSVLARKRGGVEFRAVLWSGLILGFGAESRTPRERRVPRVSDACKRISGIHFEGRRERENSNNNNCRRRYGTIRSQRHIAQPLFFFNIIVIVIFFRSSINTLYIKRSLMDFTLDHFSVVSKRPVDDFSFESASPPLQTGRSRTRNEPGAETEEW